MKKNLVAVVRYEKPLESVRKAVEMSRGLDHLPAKAKGNPGACGFVTMRAHVDFRL